MSVQSVELARAPPPRRRQDKNHNACERCSSWSFLFWNEEAAKYKFDELFASDALLLGRVTYRGFAKAWPFMTNEDGFADRMNGLPKFVASTTLKEVEWNNSRLIKGNIAEEVYKLK